MAQLRAGAPEVMRCDMLQPDPLAAAFDDIPDDILGKPIAPNLALGESKENTSLSDPRRTCPTVQRNLDPIRDWHSADVSALSDQIHDRPMTLPHLDVA